MSREEELKKELYELNKIIEGYRAREDYSSPYQTYLIKQGEIKFELKGIQEGKSSVAKELLDFLTDYNCGDEKDRWLVQMLTEKLKEIQERKE